MEVRFGECGERGRRRNVWRWELGVGLLAREEKTKFCNYPVNISDSKNTRGSCQKWTENKELEWGDSCERASSSRDVDPAGCMT